MAATYRQCSDVSDELLKKDPRNVLMARVSRAAHAGRDGARQRARRQRSAEAERSAARASIRTSPTAIWDGLAVYTVPGGRRRPRRRAPPAQLSTRSSSATRRTRRWRPSICPIAAPASVRRQTSNTPLQALVLLDDPQYIEAYRAVADERAADGGRSRRAGHARVPAGDAAAPGARGAGATARLLRRAARSAMPRIAAAASDAAEERRDACRSGGIEPRPAGGADQSDGGRHEHAGRVHTAMKRGDSTT